MTLDGATARVSVYNGDAEVFGFAVRFTVKLDVVKPEAKALGRGLMAVSLTGANMGTGNLVSWRHREADGYGVKYRLYRGTTADGPWTKLYRGMYVIDKTNVTDPDGTPESYYKIDVHDKYGNLLETEVSGKTWADQTFRIPIEAYGYPQRRSVQSQ